MDLRKTKITIGILFVLPLGGLIALLFLRPIWIEGGYSACVITIFILLSWYARQLKKVQATQAAGVKLDKQIATGLGRGRIIGVVIGVAIILFLIFYWLILISRV